MSSSLNLSSFLEESPYNNIRALFVHKGLEFPSELGGECIELARRLRAIRENEGALVKVVRTSYGHYSLMVKRGEDWFYEDPGLLQRAAVSMTPLLHGEGVRADAYPNGNWIGLNPQEGTRVDVKRMSEGGATSDPMGRFDQEKSCLFPDPRNRLVAGVKRGSLLLTKIEGDEFLRLERDVSSRTFTAESRGGSRDKKVSSAGYSSFVMSAASRIGEKANLSAVEVFGYLDHAAELYKDLLR